MIAPINAKAQRQQDECQAAITSFVFFEPLRLRALALEK
jgi:hypothetical protein